MIALPNIAVGETKVITFDFDNQAAVGAALTFVDLIKTSLNTGVDADGSKLTLGTPAVSGRTVVVSATPIVAGGVWRLKCRASAPNGSVTEVHAVIARVPSGDPAQ